jgi:hypothetical protein
MYVFCLSMLYLDYIGTEANIIQSIQWETVDGILNYIVTDFRSVEAVVDMT